MSELARRAFIVPKALGLILAEEDTISLVLREPVTKFVFFRIVEMKNIPYWYRMDPEPRDTPQQINQFFSYGEFGESRRGPSIFQHSKMGK